jgi:hypothetical protein
VVVVALDDVQDAEPELALGSDVLDLDALDQTFTPSEAPTRPGARLVIRTDDRVGVRRA